jgi:CheY-like chemotaxis protein
VLSPLDFVVLTANGATECLTLIEGVKPDLFLVDILMPGMNGWQLVERLRESGQTAPILMLSANIGDGASTIRDGDGHSDTIAKPVDIRQLSDKLALHLGLTWIYEGDVEPEPPPPVPVLKSPGETHLQDLIQLGEIGYVRGIEAKLADLDKLPENQPFTTAAGAYIQSFDLAGYLSFLNRFREERVADDA